MSDTPSSDDAARPAGPPPGWYADPSRGPGSRWWDGSAWSDHVRDEPPGDDPPPTPDDPRPTAGPATSDLPLQLSGRSRVVGLVVAGVLVIGLVATAGVGLSNRSAATVDPDGVPLGTVLDPAAVPPPLDRAAVAAASDAAGCEVVVDGAPLGDADHLGDGAPPAAVLYPDRPAHSGRHFGAVLPLPAGYADAAIDERAVVHNMEHGSVVVWVDEQAAGTGTARDVDAWQRRRTAAGFTSRGAGAVFASPMPDDLDDPPVVALRAWGVAMDCDRFDATVADAFLVEHWGTHGDAPEAGLSPYPEDSLAWAETV